MSHARKRLLTIAAVGLLSVPAATIAQEEPVTAPTAAATDTPADAGTDTPTAESQALPGGRTTAVPHPSGVGFIRIGDAPPGKIQKQPGYGSGEEGIAHSQRCVAPDHGWTPPGRKPIYRIWVPYYKFWPDAWTGHPVAAVGYRAPVVYMPTDTTQLGYYYQHVPHWHRYQGMLPPVPRPSDWRAPLYSPQPIVLAPTRTDFGTEETIPGKDPETAPTPPQNGKPLDKSAATPELIPIPR